MPVSAAHRHNYVRVLRTRRAVRLGVCQHGFGGLPSYSALASSVITGIEMVNTV